MISIYSFFAFLRCHPEDKYHNWDKDEPWNVDRTLCDKGETQQSYRTKNKPETPSTKRFHACGPSPPKMELQIS